MHMFFVRRVEKQLLITKSWLSSTSKTYKHVSRKLVHIAHCICKACYGKVAAYHSVQRLQVKNYITKPHKITQLRRVSPPVSLTAMTSLEHALLKVSCNATQIAELLILDGFLFLAAALFVKMAAARDTIASKITSASNSLC